MSNVTVRVLQETSKRVDIRVQREEHRTWRISALTPRAIHWVHANFADRLADEGDEELKANLVGTNALMIGARSAGLLTEYIGPNAIVHF
ncbi:hypothetical protein [Rhizobium binxianense]